jgi:hypothetical protein
VAARTAQTGSGDRWCSSAAQQCRCAAKPRAVPARRTTTSYREVSKSFYMKLVHRIPPAKKACLQGDVELVDLAPFYNISTYGCIVLFFVFM